MERHRDRAGRAGHDVAVERLDSLALDLDTPDDLPPRRARLLRVPSARRRRRPHRAAGRDPGRGGVTANLELVARSAPRDLRRRRACELFASAAERGRSVERRRRDHRLAEVVSKAAGRRVRCLDRVEPGEGALELGAARQGSPAVELVLAESR